MAFEPSDAAPQAVGHVSNVPVKTAASPLPLPRHKYRLRFQKAGALRLVSHIDLMHCFERLLRRAALPFASTQGFHPKPRMVFAQALALGVVGSNEVVELELHAGLPPDEVRSRLNEHAPPGIAFTACRAIDLKQSAQVRRAFYRLKLPAAAADLTDRCAGLLAGSACWVIRLRPQRRRFNVRPYVAELTATSVELNMALWITPYGAARPEEVARALSLADALEAGAVFERIDLEIIDELSTGEAWLPEIPRLTDTPPRDELEEAGPADASDPEARDSAPACRGLPHALIPNPLSFDT
jgi:radical SAM-linked protein